MGRNKCLVILGMGLRRVKQQWGKKKRPPKGPLFCLVRLKLTKPSA